MKPTLFCRIGLLAACGVISSCVVVNNPAPSQPSGNDAGHTIEATPPQEEEEGIPRSISEAVALCQEVQRDKEIPILCEARYVNGSPVMTFGFSNIESFRVTSEAAVKYIAAPFCNHANSQNRSAVVVFFLIREEMAQVYSCEMGETSGWFYPNSDDDQRL